MNRLNSHSEEIDTNTRLYGIYLLVTLPYLLTISVNKIGISI